MRRPAGSGAIRRTTSVAAAAFLLALAALPGRAAADGSPGPDAAAVWQPRGPVLAGGATTADAPAMQPAVTYRDVIGPGESRFFGIALGPSESAAASVFAVPPAGSRVSYGDGVELTLQDSDGRECDTVSAHFQDEGDARPIGSAVSRLITGDSADSCQHADQYTLEVHRTSDGTSDPGPWPLELRYVAEPGLKAGAAPPSAPPSGPADGAGPTTGTASPTPLTTGTPRPASGGPSFETAAAVRTGVWQDRVRPGGTRFYKVPVDWGQQATVFADFSSARTGAAAPAYVGSGVRLTSYSPVRELIDGQDKAYDGGPASIGEQLAPVAYGNRASLEEKVARVRYAGWYYFAVTVHPDVARTVSGAVPVTLRVEVAGDAQDGPAYAGDPSAAGIGVDAHDVSSADGSPDGGGSAAGSAGLRFAAFAAFGAGTTLLLTLAAWWIWARLTPRRPRRPGALRGW